MTAPSATAPAATASPAAGSADIYQWLPFTQAGLAAAAAVATRFGNAYGTYSYTQSAAAYGATLQPLSSASLVQQIENAYSAPGVASARTGGKQVAAGVATISSISAFGPASLTFQVQVDQQHHRHGRGQPGEHRLHGHAHRRRHDLAGHERRAGVRGQLVTIGPAAAAATAVSSSRSHARRR